MTTPDTDTPIIETMYLRLPRALKARVRAYAKTSGCTMTDAVIGLLERALREDEGAS